MMKGNRLLAEPEGLNFSPGDYWEVNGEWTACLPNGDLANLANHKVIENEDKTITVTPSILTYGGGKRWHGFLRNGVFEELEGV